MQLHTLEGCTLKTSKYWRYVTSFIAVQPILCIWMECSGTGHCVHCTGQYMNVDALWCFKIATGQLQGRVVQTSFNEGKNRHCKKLWGPTTFSHACWGGGHSASSCISVPGSSLKSSALAEGLPLQGERKNCKICLFHFVWFNTKWQATGTYFQRQVLGHFNSVGGPQLPCGPYFEHVC